MKRCHLLARRRRGELDQHHLVLPPGAGLDAQRRVELRLAGGDVDERRAQ
jgi:hypothetical protein